MAQPQLRPVVHRLRRLATRTGPVGNATDHQLLAQFIAGDTAAFEMLVQRHGGMVWEVCRRRLAQDADADDACQAVFLVLAQKAGSIRKRHSLAAWLHGVAYRVAEDAKRQAAGRRRREQTPRPTRAAPDPVQEATWREVSQLLDEELRQLAEAYRAPLVLCYLEGQTRERAAIQLGWSLRTVERRLERGRALLRGRLERRGLGLSAVLLAGGLMPRTTASANCLVPVARMACAGGTGISARVLSLADIAVKGMAVDHSRWALAALVAVSVLAAGASLTVRQSMSLHPPKQAATAIPPFSEAKHATPPSMRVDRYGDPLPPGAIMRLGTLRFCQPGASNVAFSPDGRFVISGGADNCIRFWDLRTGKDVRVLEGHHNTIDGIALSADGKLLASHTQNSDVLLWDVKTEKVKCRFHAPGQAIGWYALSPNGKVLATTSIPIAKTLRFPCPRTLRLWDTTTGRELPHSPLPGSYGVLLQSFTPDSRALAVAGPGETVDFLDVATGKVKATFRHEGGIYALAFSADGKTLLTGGVDGFIRAWDVATGRERRRYGDGQGNVVSIAVAPDGTTLTYGTHRDGLVHILDVSTGKDRVPPWKATDGCIVSIAYSPDSKRVAVARDVVAIHDTTTGKRLNPPPENQSVIQQIAYAADGRTLAVWRRDNTIELWDTKSGRKAATLQPKGDRFNSFAFSPDGKYLTTVEAKYQNGIRTLICQRDPHTGQWRSQFKPMNEWLYCLCYSADGQTLAGRVEGNSRSLVRWNPVTGKERGRFQVPLISTRSLQLSADGRWFACATFKSAVTLWNATSGRLVRAFGPPFSPRAQLVISPDGRSIATPGGQPKLDGRSEQRDIVLWETATGRERLRIHVHERQVNRLAFSPNGRLLASGSGSETIHLWDTWTGDEIDHFTGHRGRVDWLAFAPDGKTLASGGEDSNVLIWDVAGLKVRPRLAAKPLSPTEFARYRAALGSQDAARAYRAMYELTRCPRQIEQLLTDKIHVTPTPVPARVPQLIAGLDSDNFRKREHAHAELAKLGLSAEPALRETLDHRPSPEVKWRV
ncbi:MAG TPA: sigma-70 family RNA polymerase sigma factor, partial [Gemmataceae bacterium]|nr:sigma-70 family RNA polymerase sigma factor [Gemmataceae bacterium]